MGRVKAYLKSHKLLQNYCIKPTVYVVPHFNEVVLLFMEGNYCLTVIFTGEYFSIVDHCEASS